MEYSPLSEVTAERDNPVATLEAVTVALATLPPEASVILPDSVALTAWLRAVFGKMNKQVVDKTARRTWSESFHFLLITVHPQKLNLSNRPLRTALDWFLHHGSDLFDSSPAQAERGASLLSRA
jgi:hypothetical protein